MAIVITGMLVTGIFTPYGVVVGTFLIAGPFYLWAWPKKEEHERNLREEREREAKPEAAR
jgi:hypothetical protein